MTKSLFTLQPPYNHLGWVQVQVLQGGINNGTFVTLVEGKKGGKKGKYRQKNKKTSA